MKMAKKFNLQNLKKMPSPKKVSISRSLLLGSALFTLGLISLFTGHITSDIERPQLRRRWRLSRGVYRQPVDIWKSEFSNFYFGCSDRGPNFRHLNLTCLHFLVVTMAGERARKELGEIRKRWETLPDLSAEDEQSRGKCPLTPFEVGLMLRALGFGNDTYLYIASGEIYGGEETLRPLKNLFPNLYTKEMLAGDKLRPFLPFSSRLAAIDYIVCDESDVFVTNNNGNMAKILAGRRRYIGHKRTIWPNAKKLSSLFKARDRMKWETFAAKVKSFQRGFMGEPDEMRPGRGEFHEFPHSCICQKPAEPVGLPKL